MRKSIKRVTVFLLVLMGVLAILPATASAADSTYYMFVGQRGTMTITANQVPNAKWKTSNSSVLKIVKQSKTSVTTEGMKAGTAILTVYNSKKPSRKYTNTIKVLKKGKLVKQDFVFKNKRSGKSADLKNWLFKDSVSERLTIITPLSDIETYRGISYLDSYSKVCARYGKKSLKKTTTNDPLYGPGSWQSDYIYCVTYPYNSHYKIRMYFNANKQLVGLVCSKNKY